MYILIVHYLFEKKPQYYFMQLQIDKMNLYIFVASNPDDQDSADIGEKPHKRKKTDASKIPARVRF